ncbi:MAG: putative Ig domain-containing protein, partial [Synergistaceae bacterium]|nr:putative Ig domain-containing protein [Synergistaceae bacterium]
AKDSGDKTATATINVKVSSRDAFTITPSSSTVTVNVGSPVSVSFTVSGTSGTLTWSASGLPTGVTIDSSTGRISGAPIAAGTSNVTVTARNTAGRTATATITIVAGPVPPTQFTITPSDSAVTVRVGSAVSVSFTVAGTSETLAWSATGLPAGVSINPSTGVISGTPTTAGSYTATVTAKGSANEATATVSFTVEDVPVPPTPEEPTDETKELINKYESEGKLNSDGTIPSRAVSFTPTDPTAKTLNPNTTTTVKQGENLNPVALVLEFPVDIWKIYINNVLMAWAYSPGVTPAADDASIYASTGENGVIIEPSSKTEATVVFNTELMPAGNNQQIAAAFVPDVTKPTQEIGKTTLATVSVSSTTSPDEPIGVGGSGGGCDAGLGAIVLAMAATFFISKKRS